MPRREVSAADLELCTYAEQRGFVVTPRQVERWRTNGLLSANVRVALGRGRGSTSTPATGAGDVVVWLAEHAKPGLRPDRLALHAFADGVAVPEQVVRSALVVAINHIEVSAERSMPIGSAPEDVADAAVRAGARATVVPSPVRRIDAALRRAGVNWSPDELAALDRGSSMSPATSKDWAHTAVQLALGGGGSVDMTTIGALARTFAPRGAAVPLAGQIEHRWPGSDDHTEGLINEDGGLDFLPHGDLRDSLQGLARTTPLNEILEAWQAAKHLHRWAKDLVRAVEQEIDSAIIGPATIEWIFGVFGLGRLLLTIGLRGRKNSPASITGSALTLIMIRNGVRGLRRILPSGNFDLLTHPIMGPAFFRSFISGVPEAELPTLASLTATEKEADR